MTSFVNVAGLEALLQTRSEIRKHVLSLQWHSSIFVELLGGKLFILFCKLLQSHGEVLLAELQGWSSFLVVLSNPVPQLKWRFELHTPFPFTYYYHVLVILPPPPKTFGPLSKFNILRDKIIMHQKICNFENYPSF